MVKNDKKGRNMFDVNLKMVIGFREIGRGHQPMFNFSRLMNVLCLTVNAFDNISKTVKEVY